jgi:hypothetical protein
VAPQRIVSAGRLQSCEGSIPQETERKKINSVAQCHQRSAIIFQSRHLPIDRFPVPIRQQGVVAQIMHWARSFSVNVFESGQMRGNLLTLDIVNSMNWSAISGVNIASPYLTQDS